MDNHDVAAFLSNFLLAFIIVIIIHILASWLPRRPISGPIRIVLDFCDQTAEPYLAIFRSFIKPIGSGAVSLDLSPVIGILALSLFGGIIIGAIDRL
jgi:uncharacterized protein YggT (Ycf19 family)